MVIGFWTRIGLNEDSSEWRKEFAESAQEFLSGYEIRIGELDGLPRPNRLTFIEDVEIFDRWKEQKPELFAGIQQYDISQCLGVSLHGEIVIVISNHAQAPILLKKNRGICPDFLHTALTAMYEEAQTQEVWRDDGLNPHDEPTANPRVVIPRSIDQIGQGRGKYILEVDHIDSRTGKGFQTKIYSSTECVKTGQTYFGVDLQTYNKAVEIGWELLFALPYRELSIESTSGIHYYVKPTEGYSYIVIPWGKYLETGGQDVLRGIHRKVFDGSDELKNFVEEGLRFRIQFFHHTPLGKIQEMIRQIEELLEA